MIVKHVSYVNFYHLYNSYLSNIMKNVQILQGRNITSKSVGDRGRGHMVSAWSASL